MPDSKAVGYATLFEQIIYQFFKERVASNEPQTLQFRIDITPQHSPFSFLAHADIPQSTIDKLGEQRIHWDRATLIRYTRDAKSEPNRPYENLENTLQRQEVSDSIKQMGLPAVPNPNEIESSRVNREYLAGFERDNDTSVGNNPAIHPVWRAYGRIRLMAAEPLTWIRERNSTGRRTDFMLYCTTLLSPGSDCFPPPELGKCINESLRKAMDQDSLLFDFPEMLRDIERELWVLVDLDRSRAQPAPKSPATERKPSDLSTEAGTQPGASVVVDDTLVTLNQAAGIVRKSKRTLEGWRQELPPPDVIGGHGKANLWRWSKLKPALENKAGLKLPEQFPTSRII